MTPQAQAVNITPAAIDQEKGISNGNESKEGSEDTVNKYAPRDLRFYIAFISICTCTFISTVDTVIVATALPAITRALDATSNEAYWCGTGFLFAQTVSQPIYGAFQEIVGHKKTMLIALGLFWAMSILCATAQNITWLVASRVVQGLGGGGINAMVNVLVSDVVPLHERGTFVGLNNLAGAMGLVSGVVLGAAFAEKSTWRLIFYINIPICLVAGSLLFFCLRLPDPRRSFRSSVGQLDFVGVGLLTGALTSLLYGITGGGVLYPWSHARIISSLIIGTIGVCITVFHQHKLVSNPIIPTTIFSSRTASSGYFSAWVHGVVLWGLAYYLILYFLIARGHSLLRSATEILPGIATIPFCAAIFGIVMAVTKRFKWLNVAAWVSLSVGVGMLSTVDTKSALWEAYGYQLILAFGGGILFPGRILAVQVEQKAENVPISTTMVSFFTSLGEAFGVGIGGSIFQNRWGALVGDFVGAGVLNSDTAIEAHAAEGAEDAINDMSSELQALYQDIMARSLRTVWVVFAAFAGVAFFVSLAQKDLRLQEKNSDEKENSNEDTNDSANIELEEL